MCDLTVKGSNPRLDREVHSIGAATNREPGEWEEQKSFEELGTFYQQLKIRFQLLGLFDHEVLGVTEEKDRRWKGI